MTWHLNLTIPSCFVSTWRFKSPFKSMNVQPSSLQNRGFLPCLKSPSECLERMCLAKQFFLAVEYVSQYSQLKTNPSWILSLWNFKESLLPKDKRHCSQENSEWVSNSKQYVVPENSHESRRHLSRRPRFLFIPMWT